MATVIDLDHDAADVPAAAVVPLEPEAGEVPAAHPQPRPTGKVTYTVREVAAMLDLNLGGTYQLIRAGQIPAKRLGNRWIVPVHRFHAWLDAQDDEPALVDRVA